VNSQFYFSRRVTKRGKSSYSEHFSGSLSKKDDDRTRLGTIGGTGKGRRFTPLDDIAGRIERRVDSLRDWQ